MKITRRQLAAVLAPAAALAQTPPSSPADELKGAEARLKANSEALSKIEVPIEAEPAFQFKP